eukprot:4499777-Amphidinium_carterae.2
MRHGTEPEAELSPVACLAYPKQPDHLPLFVHKILILAQGGIPEHSCCFSPLLGLTSMYWTQVMQESAAQKFPLEIIVRTDWTDKTAAAEGLDGRCA